MQPNLMIREKTHSLDQPGACKNVFLLRTYLSKLIKNRGAAYITVGLQFEVCGSIVKYHL